MSGFVQDEGISRSGNRPSYRGNSGALEPQDVEDWRGQDCSGGVQEPTGAERPTGLGQKCGVNCGGDVGQKILPALL